MRRKSGRFSYNTFVTFSARHFEIAELASLGRKVGFFGYSMEFGEKRGLRGGVRSLERTILSRLNPCKQGKIQGKARSDEVICPASRH